MRIQSLGGLTLEGTLLRKPKPLMLLAYLALEGPQDRRYLAEVFWPHAADPRNSLTVALTRVRAAAPGAIEADRTRACSRVGIDLLELTEALEDGHLERGLELYRGPFLHGVAVPGLGPELEEWIYQTRELAAGRVAVASIDVAELEASRHGARRAQPRAEAAFLLPGAPPLAPHDLARLHALLAAAGSPLARRVRAEASELGVQLDPLGHVSPPEGERDRLATGGSGPSNRAVVPSARRRPWSGLRSFVGRSTELEDAMAVLLSGEDRLLSVIGPPGAGKTRFALELGRRLEEAGAGRVEFVPLEHLDQPALLGVAVAEALGYATRSPREGWGRVTHAVGDERAFLVLDGFEQLTAASPQLDALLSSCPELRLVVTSRVRLKAANARELPLEGLRFPSDADAADAAAGRSDAVRLFLERARRHRPGLTVDEATLAHVRAICRSTSGLPLALELAAAWARVMPIDEIAAELERGLDILAHDSLDPAERPGGLRAAFDRSWRLLRSAEREALQRLAVFEGDFDRPAAMAVADVSLPRLAALLDASLLRWDGARRYGLHPLIRRFVLDLAGEHPAPSNEAERRHASYFLTRLADRREAFRRGLAPARAADLWHDLPNVVSAWRSAVRASRRELLDAAVEPFGWLLYMRGRYHLGTALMTAAEAACEAAALGRFKAMYLVEEGRVEEAVTGLERVLARRPPVPLLERAHQLRVLGVARTRLPGAARTVSEPEFRQALDHYRRAGDAEGVATMLNNLANTASDPCVGLALARRAHRIAERCDEPHAQAMSLATLAGLRLWFIGDFRAAVDAAAQAERLHERSGFDSLAAHAILLQAEAHLALGDHAAVERAAERLTARHGHDVLPPDVHAAAHALRGRAAAFAGDLRTARAAAAASLAVTAAARGGGHVPARLLLARLALRDGQLDEAESELRQIERDMPGFRRTGAVEPVVLRATLARTAAAMLASQGRPREAEARLRQALDATRRARALPSRLATLAALAALWSRHDRRPRAARLQTLVAAHPSTPAGSPAE